MFDRLRVSLFRESLQDKIVSRYSSCSIASLYKSRSGVHARVDRRERTGKV